MDDKYYDIIGIPSGEIISIKEPSIVKRLYDMRLIGRDKELKIWHFEDFNKKEIQSYILNYRLMTYL